MKKLKERFQQLAGLKPLYEVPMTYGDASTLGSDDNKALKAQTHFLNPNWIDLENKLLAQQSKPMQRQSIPNKLDEVNQRLFLQT